MSDPSSGTRRSNGPRIGAIVAVGLLALVAALVVWFRSETGPDLGWMGWTGPTAIFFTTIVVLLIAMTLWETLSPGGGPRVGLLRFETTRGDRLFLSLLGAAFINLAWLGFVGGPNLWPALGVSLGWTLAVFLLV